MSDESRTATLPIQVFDRRALIRSGAVASGAALASVPMAGGRPGRWMQVRGKQATPGATPIAELPLTKAELATLRAVVDRIFPADDYGPSGTEAGVDVYINQSLATHNAGLLPLLQQGLPVFDAAAGGSFATATADTQDTILTSAEAGELDGDPGGLFATLLELARQGMFADPIHGGNVDFAGWDLIGYPGVKLVWTEADQEIDAEVTPEHISVAQYREN